MLKFLVGCIIMVGKPSKKIIDNHRVLVSKKELINMPTHSQQFAIDDLIGNTQIIGVDHETNRGEVSDKLLRK